MLLCSIELCDRKHQGGGLCKTHYMRKWKHGDGFDRSPIRPRITKDYKDGTRECTKCLIIQPLGNFHNSNTGKGGKLGKSTKCKSCDSKYKKSRRNEITDEIKAYKAESHRIRYAAKKSNSGNISITLEDIINIRGIDCMYCGDVTENVHVPRGKFNPKRSSLEHILPLSRGGNHSINNLGVSCLRCNIAKGNKTYVEYFNLLLSRVVS